MALRPRGTRPPLFWVQAGLIQAKVLQELHRDQPVYCLYRLQPDPKDPPLRFEQIAAYHIETMRSLCPRGPYALTGYCVCAPIVFEMACQLARQGETVSALILIDPLDAAVTRAKLAQPPPLFQLTLQANRVLFHMQKIKNYSIKDKLAYCTHSAKKIKERLMYSFKKRATDPGSGFARPLPQHVLLDVHDLDMYAVREYVPQPYPGSAVILRPIVVPPRFLDYPNRRWAQLIQGKLDVQTVPGDSDTMWLLPNASMMARSIDSSIAKVSPVQVPTGQSK